MFYKFEFMPFVYLKVNIENNQSCLKNILIFPPVLTSSRFSHIRISGHFISLILFWLLLHRLDFRLRQGFRTHKPNSLFQNHPLKLPFCSSYLAQGLLLSDQHRCPGDRVAFLMIC